MTDHIDYEFYVVYNFGDYRLQRNTSGNSHFYLFKHIVNSREYLFDFGLKEVTTVTTQHSFIVIEVPFSGFHIDVQIVNNMVFFSEQFFVKNNPVPFRSDQSLFDIDGQLKV